MNLEVTRHGTRRSQGPCVLLLRADVVLLDQKTSASDGLQGGSDV